MEVNAVGILGQGSQLLEGAARNDILTAAGREIGIDGLIVKNVSNWNVAISAAREFFFLFLL